jgi:hypothetical protein
MKTGRLNSSEIKFSDHDRVSLTEIGQTRSLPHGLMRRAQMLLPTKQCGAFRSNAIMRMAIREAIGPSARINLRRRGQRSDGPSGLT